MILKQNCKPQGFMLDRHILIYVCVKLYDRKCYIFCLTSNITIQNVDRSIIVHQLASCQMSGETVKPLKNNSIILPLYRVSVNNTFWDILMKVYLIHHKIWPNKVIILYNCIRILCFDILTTTKTNGKIFII